MDYIKIELPVYYTQKFKTKKDKTFLVGMNWYRNAHFFVSNKVKKDYENLTKQKLYNFDIENFDIEPTKQTYTVRYFYYYKNKCSDLMNVGSLMSKFFNDTVQDIGIVKNDNVQHCISERFDVGGLDKKNPRIEIRLYLGEENE